MPKANFWPHGKGRISRRRSGKDLKRGRCLEIRRRRPGWSRRVDQGDRVGLGLGTAGEQGITTRLGKEGQPASALRAISGHHMFLITAGLHYCCTAQDSLTGDQLTAHFEVHLEKHA